MTTFGGSSSSGSGPWGGGSYGVIPWGGGPAPLSFGGVPGGTFALLGAEPISETCVRLSFSEAPYVDGIGGVGDALDADHYAITTTGGTGLDGKPVRGVLAVMAQAVPGVATAIDVTVDRPFSPYPCTYAVSASGIYGATSGMSLAPGSTSAGFHGLLRTVEGQSRELALKNRDVASPQSPAATMDPLPDPMSAVLGSYNTDTTGDYAFDEGLTGYRKRILRRIYCRKGHFVFLPLSWGVGIVSELKRTNNAAKRESIRADIEEQVKQEPETKACAVSVLVSPQAPSVVRYRIQARTRDGRDLNVTLPFHMG